MSNKIFAIPANSWRSGGMTEPLPSAWEQDWLNYTDHEYYHRVRNIMLSYGMGEGDVEMILANVWESGWIAGKRFADNLNNLGQ